MSPRAPVGGVTGAGGVGVAVGCGSDVATPAVAHPLKEITSDAQNDFSSDGPICCGDRGLNELGCTLVNLQLVFCYES